MEKTHCVVFKGALLPGFVLDNVRDAAARKFKLPAAQIDRIFSGRTAVLKRGLNSYEGTLYLEKLRRMGMDASLEVEEPPAAPAPPRPVQQQTVQTRELMLEPMAAPAVAPEPAPEPEPLLAAFSPSIAPVEESPANTDEAAFDPDKTQINPSALDQYLASDVPAVDKYTTQFSAGPFPSLHEAQEPKPAATNKHAQLQPQAKKTPLPLGDYVPSVMPEMDFAPSEMWVANTRGDDALTEELLENATATPTRRKGGRLPIWAWAASAIAVAALVFYVM